jgi:hypothetical protein
MMFAFLVAAPGTRANAGASAPFPKLKDMAGGHAPGDDRGEHGALEAIVSLASSFSTHPKASHIHVRATRNHPLSQRQQEANRKKSRVRVFGAQETSAGSRLVRTIGIVRARAKIGLQNLVYNIRRLVTLERMALA